jgi:hypothetical protein
MHVSMIAGLSLCTLSLASACGSTIASCSDEPNLSGSWTFSLAPEPVDAGLGATIPGNVSVAAQLTQGGKTDFLGLGNFVYGTLTASDPTYFATITIPMLLNNDGSKTGATRGCEININVPIATPVTDDNVDQGPLRIALVGSIDAPGHITSEVGSTLIMSSDASGTMRSFLWTGMSTGLDR